MLEALGHPSAVDPLIRALSHANAGRKRAAVRALAWLDDRRAIPALVRVLTDSSEAIDARVEAAEGLANLGAKRSLPAILSVLHDSSVEIRFWCVFALGTTRDGSVVPALESMLSDQAVPVGWWSVGLEALGMLGSFSSDYRHKVRLEVKRIFQDPEASQEERGWAECYES